MVSDLKKLLEKNVDLIEGGGDYGGPVKEFQGNLADFDVKAEPGRKDPSKLNTWVYLRFSDIKVITSTEPWNFTTYEIRTPLFFTKDGSGVDSRTELGVIAKSHNKLTGTKGLDLPAWVKAGERLHMKITEGHKQWDSRKGEEVPRKCWEVVGVNGASPAGGIAGPVQTSEQIFLELADGKTEIELNSVAVQDKRLQADSAYFAQIIGRTALAGLMAGGKLSKNAEGKLHKV